MLKRILLALLALLCCLVISPSLAAQTCENYFSNFTSIGPWAEGAAGNGYKSITLCGTNGDRIQIGADDFVLYAPSGQAIAQGQGYVVQDVTLTETGVYTLSMRYEFGTQRITEEVYVRDDCGPNSDGSVSCFPVYRTESTYVDNLGSVSYYLLYVGSAALPPTALPTATVTAGPSPTPTNTYTPVPTVTPSPIPPEFAELTRNAYAQAAFFAEFENPVNTDWTPQEITVTQNGKIYQMVLVPAGCFQMGHDEEGQNYSPSFETCISTPFWIDKYEVTNQQYGSAGHFIGIEQPRDSLPRESAQTFCKSRGNDISLPSEMQWEYAARGVDNLIYPWGNEWDANMAYVESPSESSYNVGNILGNASWVGARNMAGNLAEHVWNALTPYPLIPSVDYTNYGTVVRGGGWTRGIFGGNPYLQSYFRQQSYSSIVSDKVGFRCVWNATPLSVAEADLNPLRANATSTAVMAGIQAGATQAAQATIDANYQATLDASRDGGEIPADWVAQSPEDGSFTIFVPPDWEVVGSFFGIGIQFSLNEQFIIAVKDVPELHLYASLQDDETNAERNTVTINGRLLETWTIHFTDGASTFAVTYTPPESPDAHFILFVQGKADIDGVLQTTLATVMGYAVLH